MTSILNIFGKYCTHPSIYRLYFAKSCRYISRQYLVLKRIRYLLASSICLLRNVIVIYEYIF